MKKSHAEISQHVITLFVSLCSLHQQQKSVTDHLRRPISRPIQANDFLSHIQFDLMDFRNLTCSCGKNHQWLLHVIDHYSKFSWLFPLISKTSEQVLQSITQLFWQIGFPKKLHTDNGKEFKNENMKDFCQRHQIELVHGAPRTPQTQGLVERNNRTAKENLTNILKEKKVSLDTWCLFLGEAAYKKSITKHRATSRTPYELVFGILPHQTHTTISPSAEEEGESEDKPTIQCEKELISDPDEKPKTKCAKKASTEPDEKPATKYAAEAIERETPDPPRHLRKRNTSLKRKTQDTSFQTRKQIKSQTNERQTSYNEKMKLARPKAKQFEVDDYVCVKIDKVDKTSSLHPNVPFGQVVEIENNYVRLATKFGLISTLISPTRLTKCEKPNVKFNTKRQITFTSACKMAQEQ